MVKGGCADLRMWQRVKDGCRCGKHPPFTYCTQSCFWTNKRNQTRAIIMYRVVHGQVAIPSSVYLTPNTQSTRGHYSRRFCIPVGSVGTFRHSLFPATIRIWNNLPSVVIMSPSIEVFTSRLAGVTLTWKTN